MSFFHKDTAKKATPGARALQRTQARRPAVDAIVGALTKRIEENHFAASIEKVMGSRS